MWLTEAFLLVGKFSNSWGVVLAISFGALGLIVALQGVSEFRKTNTTLDPRFPERTSSLVTTGVYQISRNPMYLGFLLILIGWAFYLSHGFTFVFLPAFVCYINRFQIRPEENYMQSKFGDDYKRYTMSVRRWL